MDNSHQIYVIFNFVFFFLGRNKRKHKDNKKPAITHFLLYYCSTIKNLTIVQFLYFIQVTISFLLI
ncbi:hypothetical protein CsatB_028963 [Cannabis sativa]